MITQKRNTLKHIKTFSKCIYVRTFLTIMGFEYSHALFLRYQIANCGELF